MQIRNYKFVEHFASTDRATHPAINRYNILVSAATLDDLLFWEEHLDKHELDYAIIQAPTSEYDFRITRISYSIVTDIDRYNEGRAARTNRVADILDDAVGESW